MSSNEGHKPASDSGGSSANGANKDIRIQQLLKVMVDNRASDLHLVVGTPPAMRIDGDIVRIKLPALLPEDTQRLIFQILSEDQKRQLEKNLEIDFSFGIKGLARFRSNIFYAKGYLSGVFRQIPTVIPNFESLGLPKVLLSLIGISNGLVLVTGPTGSGKSTTLAALIDIINQRESAHIITMEDPIEFMMDHRRCIVNQRELGADTLSFSKGLRSMLRQDPDVVLIGELRDLETIQLALTIAETGHLVFATLHTNSCVQTIHRVINVFPSHQQDEIRTILSFVLQGVAAQQLIPKSSEPGRVAAIEVMIPNPAIRNLIRENKIHQIYSQMQLGQDVSGMCTMNQVLTKMVQSAKINAQTALSYSAMPDELSKMLGLSKVGGFDKKDKDGGNNF